MTNTALNSKIVPPCACATYADDSIGSTNCPRHADTDPCLMISRITGRRRKGAILATGCTNCGWNN